MSRTFVGYHFDNGFSKRVLLPVLSACLQRLIDHTVFATAVKSAC